MQLKKCRLESLGNAANPPPPVPKMEFGEDGVSITDCDSTIRVLDSTEEERLVDRVLNPEDGHDTPMSPRIESPQADKVAAAQQMLSPQRQTPSAPPEDEHEDHAVSEEVSTPANNDQTKSRNKRSITTDEEHTPEYTEQLEEGIVREADDPHAGDAPVSKSQQLCAAEEDDTVNVDEQVGSGDEEDEDLLEELHDAPPHPLKSETRIRLSSNDAENLRQNIEENPSERTSIEDSAISEVSESGLEMEEGRQTRQDDVEYEEVEDEAVPDERSADELHDEKAAGERANPIRDQSKRNVAKDSEVADYAAQSADPDTEGSHDLVEAEAAPDVSETNDEHREAEDDGIYAKQPAVEEIEDGVEEEAKLTHLKHAQSANESAEKATEDTQRSASAQVEEDPHDDEDTLTRKLSKELVDDVLDAVDAEHRASTSAEHNDAPEAHSMQESAPRHAESPLPLDAASGTEDDEARENALHGPIDSNTSHIEKAEEHASQEDTDKELHSEIHTPLSGHDDVSDEKEEAAIAAENIGSDENWERSRDLQVETVDVPVAPRSPWPSQSSSVQGDGSRPTSVITGHDSDSHNELDREASEQMVGDDEESVLDASEERIRRDSQAEVETEEDEKVQDDDVKSARSKRSVTENLNGDTCEAAVEDSEREHSQPDENVMREDADEHEQQNNEDPTQASADESTDKSAVQNSRPPTGKSSKSRPSTGRAPGSPRPSTSKSAHQSRSTQSSVFSRPPTAPTLKRSRPTTATSVSRSRPPTTTVLQRSRPSSVTSADRNSRPHTAQSSKESRPPTATSMSASLAQFEAIERAVKTEGTVEPGKEHGPIVESLESEAVVASPKNYNEAVNQGDLNDGEDLVDNDAVERPNDLDEDFDDLKRHNDYSEPLEHHSLDGESTVRASPEVDERENGLDAERAMLGANPSPAPPATESTDVEDEPREVVEDGHAEDNIVEAQIHDDEASNNESARSQGDQLGGHLWEHADSTETVVHRPATEDEHAKEADDEFDTQSRASTSSHHQTAVEFWQLASLLARMLNVDIPPAEDFSAVDPDEEYRHRQRAVDTILHKLQDLLIRLSTSANRSGSGSTRRSSSRHSSSKSTRVTEAEIIGESSV
ncbi:hypothetical protein AAVH_05268 [Aphelenchoides avenae]|nr:hypothetical protein AAVH_05268 [Aphelenchus avenae]